jgi:hypothetical protein
MMNSARRWSGAPPKATVANLARHDENTCGKGHRNPGREAAKGCGKRDENVLNPAKFLLPNGFAHINPMRIVGHECQMEKWKCVRIPK